MIERIHHERVGSTNDLARSLARGGVDRPVLISADRQTDGRGREGRRWASPIGGAWMSLIWPAAHGRAHPAAAALVAGLAIADAIADALRAVTPRHDPSGVRLKWPNDVLLDGRKAAGVLCERELTPGRPPGPLVIGVGVNVANDPGALAGELGEPVRTPATSLSAHAFAPISPASVVDAFAIRAEALLSRLDAEGFAPRLRAAVESRLVHGPGTAVGMPEGGSGGASVGGAGVVVGLDAEGRLEVRGNDGVVRAFASGEIRLG